MVARIGFGAMQLEGRNADRDTALAVLRQAVGGGVNHIDTAQFYGDCNALIRAALAPYPDDLVLVSKVGAERDAGGGLVPAQRPDQLRAQVEANLATLGAERLDVVNLRRLDAAPGIVAEGDQLVDIDDQLAELAALRDAGKIGGIGLSSVSAGQLDRAAPAGIACVQNLYSVIDRTAEPVLDRCRDARRRLGAVLPARLGVRQPGQGDRRPDRDRHRGRARRHSRPGRAGLAARVTTTARC